MLRAAENIEKINEVWKQKNVPVIYRKGKGHPLILRLPYLEDNRTWLKGDKKINPKWKKDKKYWEVPVAWLNDLVNRSLERWQSLYIIQPYVEHEVCAPACWKARGHECQCSCMGGNHGSHSPDGNWYIVSDTFAVRHDAKELACRLLKKKPQ